MDDVSNPFSIAETIQTLTLGRAAEESEVEAETIVDSVAVTLLGNRGASLLTTNSKVDCMTTERTEEETAEAGGGSVVGDSRIVEDLSRWR
jgi:hypothetical protein